MKYDYQLIIIGAGSGGLTAADLASGMGFKRVCMVEAAEVLGGECLNSGCVPSKALLHAAKLHYYSDGKIKTDGFKHVKDSISAIVKRSDNDQHYTQKGIDVIHGRAKFIDKHTIAVGEKRITSKYFLISTGSSPAELSIEGLQNVTYRTNETIFDLKKAPESIAIIGGGPIGSEMATAFGMLGSKVTQIEHNDRILAREEQDVSEIIADKIKGYGVDILTNANTTKISKKADKIEVIVEINNNTKKIIVDELLVAVGRKPNLNLNLEAAGITYTKKGIAINKYLQTSASNIYAVGDCTESLKFTHLAAHQAGVALTNMITPVFNQNADRLNTVPWITYTSPAVGRIGLSESEAEAKSIEYAVHKLNLHEIDRAITDQEDEGFIKVLIDKKGKIIGATVVSESAGELLAPLSHIFYHKQPLNSLTTTVMPYPTLSSGLNILASQYSVNKVKSNSMFKLVTRKWR